MTTTKERPILFSGPMVKAVMADRKTQTRRVVNPQPEHWQCQVPGMEDIGGLSWKGHFFETDACPGNPPNHASRLEDACPYGQPGDRLWVRETWAARLDENDKPDPNPHYVKYRADHDKASPYDPMDWHRWPDHWRPSIFMPRWASRLTLEVIAVRVERLNAISEDDARAEGAMAGWLEELDGRAYDNAEREWCRRSKSIDPAATVVSARGAFSTLWDRINGKRHPWASNPWVWVVEFRRTENA